MSIATDLQKLETDITNAYILISNNQGTIPNHKNTENLSDAIDSINNPKVKDVNFFDYDGSLLYAYTKNEFSNLSALPTPPTHSGLISRGWNWTLQKISEHIQTNGFCNIGAVYSTDDNNTRLYLNIPDSTFTSLPFYYQIANGTLRISVDGVLNTEIQESSETYVNGNYTINLPTYENYPANCLIELAFSGNGKYKIGQGAYRTKLFGYNTDYSQTLKKVEMSNKCEASDFMFYGCNGLETIILPYDMTSMGVNMFYNCINLKFIVIPTSIDTITAYAFNSCTTIKTVCVPSTLTTISAYALRYSSSMKRMSIPSTVNNAGTYIFNNCFSLEDLSIPTGINEITNYMYYGCSNLKEIIIPNNIVTIGTNAFQACNLVNKIEIANSVTSIGANSFGGMYLLREVDLSSYKNPSSIPTLANTNVFASSPTDMKIYVANQSMLNAFKTATNWSSFANRFEIGGKYAD